MLCVYLRSYHLNLATTHHTKPGLLPADNTPSFSEIMAACAYLKRQRIGGSRDSPALHLGVRTDVRGWVNFDGAPAWLRMPLRVLSKEPNGGRYPGGSHAGQPVAVVIAPVFGG